LHEGGNLIIQSIKTLVPRCYISLIEPSSYARALAMSSGADDLLDDAE
jgi:hypothetical protein